MPLPCALRRTPLFIGAPKLARKSKKIEKDDKQPSHPIKKEIKGLVFLVIAIILGGSFLSYHPGDQLLWSSADSLGKAHNLFGAVGAHLAGSIFFLLGFSSFWLVAILVVMAILAFRGQPLSSAVKSIIASIALPLSFSGLLNLQLSALVNFKGTAMPPGGFIGLHIASLTEGFLNHFGAYLLLLVIFIISLMLITHLSLGWLFSKIWTWLVIAIRRIGDLLEKRKERRRRARKTLVAKARNKKKPKVKIIKPTPEPSKKPKQQTFSFIRKLTDLAN